MKLAEWTTLSDDQQRKLIVQWHKNWQKTDWDYTEMANKAAQSLKKKFNGIPEITHVQVGGGEIIGRLHAAIPVRSLILNVCTSLPESKKLENLPSRHAGFHVKQIAFGDKRDAFLKTLKCCFRKLKGWNERETMKWVKKRDLIDALQGGFFSGPVYSHGPVKEVLAGMLDKKTNESVKAAGNDLIKLRNDLISIIWDAVRKAGSSEYYHPDRIENFDWKAVKKKIEVIIESYCRVKQQN